MKPIAISSCLALAAFSLYAAEPQSTTALPQHTETVLSSKQAAGIGDSPLVRAAKSTNRLNKKPSQVITNETLVHAGGHFTTTTAAAQAQLPAPPVATAATPTLDQMAAEQRHARTAAATTAARAAKLQEQKKAAAAQAAARAEGDTPEALYNDPPALEGPIPTVRAMTPETLGQPQTTTAPQKPPK
jgi:hypothetical protein